MDKLEYALDIFKGTCELNVFNKHYLPTYSDNEPRRSLIEVASKLIEDKGKFYFFGPTYKNDETYSLGAIITSKNDLYSIIELINLSVKYLYNLGIEDVSVIFKEGPNKFKFKDELKEELDSLYIVCDFEEELDLIKDRDDNLGFDISIDGEVVAHGGVSNKNIYVEFEYSKLEESFTYRSDENIYDAYILPKSEKVFTDALSIGVDLRDSGFKVEIDYDLKEVDIDNIKSQYLITLDETDIKKYRVHLVDLGTKEEKEIMIDNLIEELSFM